MKCVSEYNRSYAIYFHASNGSNVKPATSIIYLIDFNNNNTPYKRENKDISMRWRHQKSPIDGGNQ